LKQFSKTIVGLIILVAPRAGAWIETYSIHQPQNQDEASPPVRGRGLKLIQYINHRIKMKRRPPCGGVD